MDLEARIQWGEYSRAKDEMVEHTDVEEAPWYVVHADVKRHARLNCITHLLGQVEYQNLTPDPVALPERGPRATDRPDIDEQNWVPAVYGSNPTGHRSSPSPPCPGCGATTCGHQSGPRQRNVSYGRA